MDDFEFHCVSDRYDSDSRARYGYEEFHAMCENVFGERAQLREAMDGGSYVDETGALVLVRAYDVGDVVRGGEPGTDDYDEGRVLAVTGATVDVGWSSGTRTRVHASMLRPI